MLYGSRTGRAIQLEDQQQHRDHNDDRRRGESNPAAEACLLISEGLLVRRMSQCPQSIACEIGSSIVPMQNSRGAVFTVVERGRSVLGRCGSVTAD